MNRTEKAYFKKFSALHVMGNENNYVRLFDFIDSMSEYDENIIIKHFSGEKFVKQFSVAKNYLYKAVLRSLKLYRKSKRKRDEARELIEMADVLIDKRLFSQAKKLLRKCRKISDSYEVYSQLLQVLVLETRIAISEKAYDEKNDTLVNRNYSERFEILDKIENAFRFDLIEYNITARITRQFETKSKSNLKALNSIISDELLASENSAKSLTARMKFNHIYAAYYYAAGRLEESYKYLNREIEILSAKTELLEERINDYYILLSNRLVISLELKKYGEFKRNIEFFRNELNRKSVAGNEKLQFYIINNSYLIEMNYSNKTGNFNRTIELGQILTRKLEKYGYSMIKNDEYLYYSLLSQAFFGLGNFDKSLESLNHILNDAEAVLKYGNIVYARIYALVIHYELGNLDLLDYLIKSTYRYLLKNDRLFLFEKLIFSFLRKLPDAVEQKELMEKFTRLKKQLMKIKGETSVKAALNYFDFINWMENKFPEI